MSLEPSRVPVIIAAVIIVLLQALVAPNIAVFGITPNFILAYSLVIALLQPHNPPYITSFVLGLIFSFMGGGPVGSLAFCLVLATFVCTRISTVLSIDTPFMYIALLVVSTFAVELVYGILLMICGLPGTFGDVLVYRVLPCGLYDSIIGLILFLIMSRLVTEEAPRRTDITQLR